MPEVKTPTLVEMMNEIESIVAKAITPLVTGTAVSKSVEDQQALHNFCKRLDEIGRNVRTGHDKFVKFQIEAGVELPFGTIRKTKESDNGKGFLNGI